MGNNLYLSFQEMSNICTTIKKYFIIITCLKKEWVAFLPFILVWFSPGVIWKMIKQLDVVVYVYIHIGVNVNVCLSVYVFRYTSIFIWIFAFIYMEINRTWTIFPPVTRPSESEQHSVPALHLLYQWFPFFFSSDSNYVCSSRHDRGPTNLVAKRKGQA